MIKSTTKFELRFVSSESKPPFSAEDCQPTYMSFEEIKRSQPLREQYVHVHRNPAACISAKCREFAACEFIIVGSHSTPPRESIRHYRPSRGTGVIFNLSAVLGTGGGSTVEESTEITFSKKAKSA